MSDFKKYFYDKIDENSTKDAKETLDAILGFLKDKDKLTDKEEEIRDMGIGMMDFYLKKKSFSPDQAKWIYNTSKAFFESYKEFKGNKLNEKKVTSTLDDKFIKKIVNVLKTKYDVHYDSDNGSVRIRDLAEYDEVITLFYLES